MVVVDASNNTDCLLFYAFVAANIFGSGDSSDSISQQWLAKYKDDDAAALADLVNSIIQSAGCDLEVTIDDIRDPENIPNRLVDLQNVYQEVRTLFF